MLAQLLSELSTSDAVVRSDTYWGWASYANGLVASGDYSEVAKQDRTGTPEDFGVEEAAIALVLAKASAAVADDVLNALFAGNDVSRMVQNSAVADRIAQTAYTRSTDRSVRQVVGLLVDKGADKTATRSVISARARESILEGMSRSAKYYTNNYFNRIVMPELFRQVDMVVDNVPGYTLSTVRAALDARLKSVPYWRMVANSAASRAYHYGFLKGASVAGYSVYQYEAVIDDVTSEICLGMDGKTFSVASGVAWVEKLAALQTVEDVVEAAPYIGAEESRLVHDYSTTQLTEMGLLVPPLHPNCRSTLRLLY